MNRLDRYLAWNIARGWLLVLLILATLFSFLVFVEELEDVGKGRYQVIDALSFVLYTLPRRLLELQPFAALLGGIVALGVMANANELTAMRAAGVSLLRVAATVVQFSLVLLLLALFVAEYVAPPLDRLALARRVLVDSADTTSLHATHGFWTRQDTQYLYVRNLLYGHTPTDIYIYQFDADGRLSMFTKARSAAVGEDGLWMLRTVEQRTLANGDEQRRKFDSLPWQTGISDRQLSVLGTPPHSLALSSLYDYIRDAQVDEGTRYRYTLAFWQQLATPLATCLFMLLPLPLLFGSLRQVSVGQRIVLGAAVGMGFYLLNQIVSNLGQILSLPPVWVVLAPILLMAVLALGLLQRTQYRR